VAGLAGKIPVDEMVGKKIVAVTNLKPAKMRGIESTAMFLAASDGAEGDSETVELLNVPLDVPNGELLSIDGMEVSEPDPMMKSKGALKAFDRAKQALRSNSDGEAIWADDKECPRRLLTSAGPVTTTSLKDAVIQ
jgi:tRNA-binding EMAP/Myf-like protein